MSDVSGGPGWWLASDGRWYRPEQHPDYRPSPPPPAAPPEPSESLFVPVTALATMPNPVAQAVPAVPVVQQDPGKPPLTAEQRQELDRIFKTAFAQFPFTDYDGGSPAHPQPEPSGMLLLMRTGDFQFHPTDSTQYFYGGLNAYSFVAQPTGPTSCDVLKHKNTDTSEQARFRLPTTSAETLQAAIQDCLRQAKQTAPAQQHTQPVPTPAPVPQPKPAQQSVAWWSGIKPRTLLYNCHYAGARNQKEMGTLKATASGIEYKGNHLGAARVSSPWAEIARIEIIEAQQRHGKQHSAIGIGPVGLAVVGATMLSNRRDGRVDTIRVVRLTTKDGKHGDFVPKDTAPRHLAPILEIISHIPR